MAAMAQAVEHDLLGIGIYTPAEAALYARLPVPMLQRWLFGNRSGDAVIHPQLGATRIVTFRDFVQAMAVRSIRRQRRVSLQKIREAIEETEKRYGLSLPLARRHRIYQLADNILIRLEAGKDDLVQVTGEHSGHMVLYEIAEVFMKDLYFDSADGLASSYDSFTYRGDRVFTMNPAIQMGQPILNTCKYSASALVSAFRTEGTVETAAAALGVEPEDIDAANAYADFLQDSLAA